MKLGEHSGEGTCSLRVQCLVPRAQLGGIPERNSRDPSDRPILEVRPPKLCIVLSL